MRIVYIIHARVLTHGFRPIIDSPMSEDLGHPPMSEDTGHPPDFWATNVRLIDLDRSVEPFASRSDHCPSQLVQPGPGCLVATQAKYALKTECTGAVLLACNEPHRLKPDPQWLASVLKHGSRRNRDLTTTLPTMQIAPRGNPGRGLAPAARALISLRPTDAKNITPAGGLIRKPAIKLLEIPGVVVARHGSGKGIHAPTHYITEVTCVKWIPPF